ncbi:MAG: HK97 family phage prohead protease [Bacteroidales bacterium]|nr:HK97 family phage prohead protease [Bacteroidales bacterium]
MAKEKRHTFVLTDESVNSYGYRVLAGGLDRTQFLKNPVMLYSHEYGLLPIGNWEDVREADGQLLADAKFDEGDAFAMEIARKVEAGVIRCCSIGFNVLEVDDSEGLKMPGQTGPTVTKAELLECSICTFGANRNAMRLANTTSGSERYFSAEGEPTGTATVKPGARMTLTRVEENINPLNSLDMTEQEKQEMEQLKSQVTTLTHERDEVRQELERVREAEIETLLTAAVGDGRIGEAEKASWKEMLKLTPESAKAALAKLNPRTSLSQTLEKNRGKGEFAGKSWAELDRTGRLSAYKAADPEGFKALYRETFNADYRE